MQSLNQAIYDSNLIPSKTLPGALRVQLTAFLGLMWASILCAGAGVWLVFGETLFLQVFVAFGTLMTGLTFHRASCVAACRDQAGEQGSVRHGVAWRA